MADHNKVLRLSEEISKLTLEEDEILDRFTGTSPVEIDLQVQGYGPDLHITRVAYNIRHVRNVLEKAMRVIHDDDVDRFAIAPTSEVNISGEETVPWKFSDHKKHDDEIDQAMQVMTPDLKRFSELSFNLDIGEYYVLAHRCGIFPQIFILTIDYFIFDF